jgi:hypothetical protein
MKLKPITTALSTKAMVKILSLAHLQSCRLTLAGAEFVVMRKSTFDELMSKANVSTD